MKYIPLVTMVMQVKSTLKGFFILSQLLVPQLLKNTKDLMRTELRFLFFLSKNYFFLLKNVTLPGEERLEMIF